MSKRSTFKETLLWRLLELILCALTQERHDIRLGISVGPITQKRRNTLMEITINNEQQVKVTLNPTTTGGHVAELDGTPSWERLSGESTVEPSEDGKSAQLISGDQPGDSEFLVTADADLGDGVIEISDVIRLHVSGALAENLGLRADPPTPKV